MCRIECRYFKTHKGPWSQDHQAEHRIAAVDPGCSKGLRFPARKNMRHTERCRHNDPGEKNQRKDRMDPLERRLCRNKKNTCTRKYQNRHQSLAKINVMSGDGVISTALRRIGEQCADDKEQCCAIKKNDSQIGKT